MIVHPSLSVLCVAEEHDSNLEPLLSFLRIFDHVRLSVEPRLPGDLTPYDVVLTKLSDPTHGSVSIMEDFVHAGGGWLGLAEPSLDSLPELFGVQPGQAGPRTELRVRFHRADHPLAVRLPEFVYLEDQHRPLESAADDVEVVLITDWRHEKNPVLVTRQVGRGRLGCTTLQAFAQPSLQQILYRLLSSLAGRESNLSKLGAGIVGYSPFVGKVHGLGVEATPGLNLIAACDLDPQRLEEAQQDFPEIRAYESVAALGDDPDVKVVIVATPPNSHAKLALQSMQAGKHVVCEKPLALNQRETAAMVEMSDREQVHLSCYQNRRWDADYLAVKQAVDEGLIGDLFYLETFVGGFAHPCGLWHSHEAISGGTAYDWGAHYLDWVVSLIPEEVTSVIGTRQKKVWHDTTNADHERIQVRFAGGQEAEFLHSDVAALRKPKWYLLGTEGAIVGRWRDVTTYEVDPIHYFQEHDIPATEMAADLTLYRRHRSGQIVVQTLPLPEREPHAFYLNLADHLLTGEPIVAPLEQSVRVVAILETAARSARAGGTVEVLHG